MACRLDGLRPARVSAGYSITELARRSTTSDWIIVTLESGGACTNREAQCIADALGLTLEELGFAPL